MSPEDAIKLARQGALALRQAALVLERLLSHVENGPPLITIDHWAAKLDEYADRLEATKGAHNVTN